ncbi:hypothetical protein GJ496_002467, partial [Pomphorhynchus laevis]
GDLLPLTAANTLGIRITVISSIEKYSDNIEFIPASPKQIDKNKPEVSDVHVYLAFTQYRKGHYNSTQAIGQNSTNSTLDLETKSMNIR